MTAGLIDPLLFRDAILDTMIIGIVAVELSGKFHYCNAKFVAMWGIPPEVLASESADQMVAYITSQARDPARFLRLIKANWAQPDVETICNVELKDGRTLERHGSPLHVDGRLVGVLGSFRDITESKRAEAILQESQARLQLATEASKVGPWDWDLITDQVHFSPEWKSQLGHTEDEIAGQFYEFVNRLHPDDHDRIMAAVQAYIADPLIGYEVEFRMRHKNGSYRWIHTRATLFFDSAGTAVRMLGCHLDFTERRSAEQERRLAERDKERISKQLIETSRKAGMAEIATNVIHNVGNVLNSVNVSCNCLIAAAKSSTVTTLAKVVGLLRQHDGRLSAFLADDPKGKLLPRYLELLSEQLVTERAVSLEELVRLQANVDHIKQIVSMQQGYSKVSGVREFISVVDLVEDLLRMHATVLGGVAIVREFEAVPLINTDKHKILQILVNLIRNAESACRDSDRVDKQLTLRIASSDGWLRIGVLDNGIGIASENLTRIFGHGFTTKSDGHGFGLHSGALAAKELGGTLHAHSDGVRRGATFLLALPLERPVTVTIPVAV